MTVFVIIYLLEFVCQFIHLIGALLVLHVEIIGAVDFRNCHCQHFAFRTQLNLWLWHHISLRDVFGSNNSQLYQIINKINDQVKNNITGSDGAMESTRNAFKLIPTILTLTVSIWSSILSIESNPSAV